MDDIDPLFIRVWPALAVNLDLEDTFGLTFLFCDAAGVKDLLFQSGQALLHERGLRMQRTHPEVIEDLADRLLSKILSSSEGARGHALWLDLDSHPDQPLWEHARTNFFARLNERRSALAHARAGCPVIFALPADWTKKTAEAAPDLWTIRQPSIFVQPVPPSLPKRCGTSP